MGLSRKIHRAAKRLRLKAVCRRGRHQAWYFYRASGWVFKMVVGSQEALDFLNGLLNFPDYGLKSKSRYLRYLLSGLRYLPGEAFEWVVNELNTNPEYRRQQRKRATAGFRYENDYGYWSRKRQEHQHKYATDPEFRKQNAERCRKYRERKKAEFQRICEEVKAMLESKGIKTCPI